MLDLEYYNCNNKKCLMTIDLSKLEIKAREDKDRIYNMIYNLFCRYKQRQSKKKNNEIVNNNELKNNVLILNYSYSGYYAAKNALANKYNVMYLEKDNTLANELRADHDLQSLIIKNGCYFNVIDASYDNLIHKIKNTDILITTNQLPTTKTSIRITKDMIDSMPQGSVFINLDAETGFASNSEKKPTIIDKP